jgi:hypothetical protein
MKLNKQQTATVLLALRYVQTLDPLAKAEIFEDSAHFEEVESIDPAKIDNFIDALCEEINFDGEEPKQYVRVADHDGNDQVELQETEYTNALVEALTSVGYSVLTREEYKAHMGE